MQINVELYENKQKVEDHSKKYKDLMEEKIKKLTALQEQVLKDLNEIDRKNLVTESNHNISKYHRYLSLLTEERITFAKMKTKKELFDGEVNEYYRFHWDKSTKLTESAIGKYVAAHPLITSISNLVRVEEAIVEYLEGVVQTFGNRNFTIKNIIEASKLELGLT